MSASSSGPFRAVGTTEVCQTDFVPIVRSGGWADIGFRPSMEDTHVCVDNITLDYGISSFTEVPNAFYAVSSRLHDVYLDSILKLWFVFLFVEMCIPIPQSFKVVFKFLFDSINTLLSVGHFFFIFVTKCSY